MLDKKTKKAFKRTFEKVVENYPNVVISSKANVNLPQRRQNESSDVNHNIGKSIRLRGIPGDHSKSRDGNCVQANAEVKEVTKITGVGTQVVKMRRLRKFTKDRKKPRILKVTLSNEHEARLVLAKCFQKTTELAQKSIYVSQATAKEEAERENLCLRRQRQIRQRRKTW